MSAEARNKWWISAAVAAVLAFLGWGLAITRQVGLTADRLDRYKDYPEHWSNAKDIVLGQVDQRIALALAAERNEVKIAIKELTSAVHELKIEIAQMKRP